MQNFLYPVAEVPRQTAIQAVCFCSQAGSENMPSKLDEYCD